MREKLVLLFSVTLLTATFNGYANNSKAKANTSEVSLVFGSMTVYDYGTMKLHVYKTSDALGDTAYILEGENALVGIELPSFITGLEVWKKYINELGKPMHDIFLSAHAAGASYVKGMKIYGTEKTKNAILSGSTYATTQGLYKAFGKDFHGGDDIAQISDVILGSVTVGGMVFNVIDRGDTYDLEIPALNAVYTHMLGKNCHSILVSAQHMNAMLAALKEYQQAGYDIILSAHTEPEGQDAVTEKIVYVKKAKELAASCKSKDAFMLAMQKAFPQYTGENYLKITAGFLYQ